MDELLRQHLSKLGKKGAKSRMTKLTDEERRKIARNAAKARWAKARRKKAKR